MAEKGAIYTAKVIAQLLNLSEKRVKQLASEGIIEEFSSGYYKLIPAVQGYVKYLQNQISDDDHTSDYNTEKAKLTKAKREDAELDLKLKKKMMHNAADVEFVTTNMLVAFKAKLETLPHKVMPGIINITDENTKEEQVLSIVSNAVNEALNELSGYNPEQYDMDKYLGTLDDTVTGADMPEKG